MKNHPITVANFKLNSQAKKYLNQIIVTSRLTYGPFTRKLEAKFARLHGRKWSIFTSSGTGALQVGLAALKEINDWQDGDEILVPAISFVSTANIVYQLRLKPVFVDVELKTYNLDPQQLVKHITPKTRAVIPVHVLGLPANMPAINELAKKHGLKVLEDSCDTMFVGINHQPVGSFGDLAAFSTYVAHLLPTGVGGFLVGDSPKIELIARSYLFHGRNSDYLSIDDDTGDESTIKNRFRFDRLGFHYRLTEMEAAIGLSQLEADEYKQGIRKRQQLAQQLLKLLKPLGSKLQLPTIPAGFEHAFMMFPLLIKDKSVKRWELIKFLENQGINTRELLPLLNQPAYIKVFGNLENQYPMAKIINRHGFYVGCHPFMTPADIKYIAVKLHEFFSK